MPRWRFRCRPQGAAPPIITSLGVGSVDEGATLSFALTANESVTWAISGGADAAKFEISGSTLRWASNGTKDYSSPDDTGANNVYDVIVRATSATTGRQTTKAIAITVAEVVIPPPVGDLAPTVSVKTNERKLLNLAVIDSVPDGNDVEIVSVTGTGLLSLVAADNIFQAGDNLVAPGASWNGTWDSGYASWTEDGNARTMSPDKTTADGNGTAALGYDGTGVKVPMRLVTVPHHRFAEDKVVGVTCDGAEMAYVRAYIEGTVLDIAEPSVWYYTDVNGVGKSVSDFYGITLDHSAILAQVPAGGAVSIYFRGVPADGTKETILLGGSVSVTANKRIVFHAASTPHSHRIELAPSAAPMHDPTAVYPNPVARLPSFDDCTKYVRGVATSQGYQKVGGCAAPLIIATETTTQTPTSWPSAGGGGYADYLPTGGMITVAAETGVTLKLAGTDLTYTRMHGFHLRGSNVVFDRTDPRFKFYYLSSTTSPHAKPFHYDGITFSSDVDYQQYLTSDGYVIASTGGANLVPMEIVSFFESSTGGGWAHFTDNDMMNTAIQNFGIALNNRMRGILFDIFSVGWVVKGNMLSACNKTPHYWTKNAMSVSYTGSSLSARVMTSTTSYTLQTSETNTTLGSTGTSGWTSVATFLCADYPRIADMVAAINAWSAANGGDWTFTALAPNTNDPANRRLTKYAAGLFAAKLNGAAAGGTITTFLDIHSDFYDCSSGIAQENIVLADNLVWDSSGFQPLIFADTNTKNVAVYNNSQRSGGGITGIIANRTHSNLKLKHNAVPVSLNIQANSEVNQGVTIAWSDDQYVEFSNNVTPALAVSGALLSQTVFSGNHADTRSGTFTDSSLTSSPATSDALPRINTASSFPEATMPSAVPTVVFDAIGNQRSLTASAKGPLEYRMTSRTLTKAQAQKLAVVNLNETAAASANVVNIRWKESAGNAGSYVNMTLTLDAVA